MDHVAPVAENLNLNMARPLDEFLDVEPTIAESRACLGRDRRQVPREFFRVAGHANAAPAARGRRFQHHRETDFRGQSTGSSKVVDHALAAGNGRHGGRACRPVQ